MTDTPMPPDGWYPDPAGGGGTRRWDGSAWTDEVRPAADEQADAAPLASPPESSEHTTGDVAPEVAVHDASASAANPASGEPRAPEPEAPREAAAAAPGTPPTPPAPVAPAYPAAAAPAGYPAQPRTTASSDVSRFPAAPGYSPAPGHPGMAAPATRRDIPTDTVWVWLIVALPLVTVLALFLFDWRSVIEEAIYAAVLSEQGAPSSTVLEFSVSSTLFSLGMTALAVVTGGLSVLFAFLDWRQLRARGIEKPFHWAWAFFVFIISAGVYVIGRGIVLRRQTGKGLGPVRGFIAVTIVSIIAGTIWLVLLMRDIFALFEQMPYIYGY